ncbi:uncharacterized protein LOC126749357 isoform X1 [Anthonomus grandis grandis]|uniref:uncharacterized protein LOC126749357 isoform X1 n=1 Tax=Anthonomus grandis grandis TaxID=2921223 RepID=UPI00216682CA|nr:uncharacterized protein LOC126749357 isoform X1 [Anthonomus grandis grandis]
MARKKSRSRINRKKSSEISLKKSKSDRGTKSRSKLGRKSSKKGRTNRGKSSDVSLKRSKSDQGKKKSNTSDTSSIWSIGKKKKHKKGESEPDFSIWESESSVNTTPSTTATSVTSVPSTTATTRSEDITHTDSYIRSISDYELSVMKFDDCPDYFVCKEDRTGRDPKMIRVRTSGLGLLFVGFQLIIILLTAAMGVLLAITINFWTYNRGGQGRRMAIPYTDIYFPAENLLKETPKYCIYQNLQSYSSKSSFSYCLDDYQADVTEISPLMAQTNLWATECLNYYAPQQLFSYDKKTQQISKPRRAIVRDGQRMCLEAMTSSVVSLNYCHPKKKSQRWTLFADWFIYNPLFDACLTMVKGEKGPAAKKVKLANCNATNKAYHWRCLKPLYPERPPPPATLPDDKEPARAFSKRQKRPPI